MPKEVSSVALISEVILRMLEPPTDQDRAQALRIAYEILPAPPAEWPYSLPIAHSAPSSLEPYKTPTEFLGRRFGSAIVRFFAERIKELAHLQELSYELRKSSQNGSTMTGSRRTTASRFSIWCKKLVNMGCTSKRRL